MKKRFQHADRLVDTEFENVYSNLDFYVADIIQPTSPNLGMIWFNPRDGLLKIWDGKQFISITGGGGGGVWGSITGTLSSQADLQTALNAKQAKLQCSGWVTPTGLVDSSNTTYTIPDDAIAGTDEFTVNGILYFDYSYAAKTYSCTDAPPTGSIVKVRYWKLI